MSDRPVFLSWSSPALAAFSLGILVRGIAILLQPDNFAFDAFQRWGGRDHILVQGWLPATQSILWAVHRLGGGLLAVHLALSVVGAGAAACATVVAERFGGRTAAWATVGLSLLGPTLAWTRVPYQEGLFLLCVFGGLALETRGRPLLGDLVFGLAGLVRYEGWIFLAAWIAWRRTPRALVSLWGPAVWMVLYGVLGHRGYAASPTDFDDWENLYVRFSPVRWADHLFTFGQHAWACGGLTIALASLWGIVIGWRRARRDTAFLVALALVQLAITVAWIAGLDAATVRMQIIPASLLTPLAAAAFADVWDDVHDLRVRALLAGSLAIFSLRGIEESDAEARAAIRYVSAERNALVEMERYTGIRWWIEPRRGLGTRARHDGCEVIQGLAEDLVHGRDYWCGPWVPIEDAPAEQARADGLVRWVGRRYEVLPTWPEPDVVAPRRGRTTSPLRLEPSDDDEEPKEVGDAG